MATTKSGGFMSEEYDASNLSIRPSDVRWSDVRSLTVIRLVGKAVHIRAPKGGHVVYQPALISANSPVEQAVADVDLSRETGSQQLSSLVAFASFVYAHLGVIDQSGHVLITIPISLGVVLRDIRYWPRSSQRCCPRPSQRWGLK